MISLVAGGAGLVLSWSGEPGQVLWCSSDMEKWELWNDSHFGRITLVEPLCKRERFFKLAADKPFPNPLKVEWDVCGVESGTTWLVTVSGSADMSNPLIRQEYSAIPAVIFVPIVEPTRVWVHVTAKAPSGLESEPSAKLSAVVQP